MPSLSEPAAPAPVLAVICNTGEPALSWTWSETNPTWWDVWLRYGVSAWTPLGSVPGSARAVADSTRACPGAEQTYWRIRGRTLAVFTEWSNEPSLTTDEA